MSIFIKSSAFITDEAMRIVARERAVALSAREWKHRLKGCGYSIRDTDDSKHMLETLPNQAVLCELL